MGAGSDQFNLCQARQFDRIHSGQGAFVVMQQRCSMLVDKT